jgi:hypothetical protein
MPGKAHKRAVSKTQQRFMGMCGHDPQHASGKCPAPAVAREIAKTGSMKNLPERVKKK